MTFFRMLAVMLFIACVGCTTSQSPDVIQVGEDVLPPIETPLLDTKTAPQTISPTNTINPPTFTPTYPSTPTQKPTLTQTPTSKALPWEMLDKDEQWVAFIDANSNLLLAYEDGSGGGLLAEGVSLAAVYMGDVCPKWSPDGRKIAFSTSMKNVTVKDVIDGSSISIGVDNDLSSFAWHPGGKMLAVIGVNTSGQGGVHLVNAQNGKELAYAPGRWAAFSPDGSRLAIVRWDNRESLTNQILIYDLVIDPSSGLATGYNPPETRTLYLDYLWNPLWSPDGQSLVFAGGIYGVGSGNTHIYLLKLDETDPICLYSDNLSPMQMAWSPDGDKLRDGERLSGGKQIAFIGAIQPDKGSASPLHAFVVKASGGGLKDLTDESDVYANCLSWAPDGSRLFYATPFHLYLAQADGSGLQEVNSVEGWYLGGFFRPMP